MDNEKPIVSFGLLTDVQFADTENVLNYNKDRVRFFRNSINLVKEAVRHWSEIDNFRLIIQLGDLIDVRGVNDRDKLLNVLLDELKHDFKSKIPNFQLYHVWGNHEFYNFKRNEIVNTELNSAKLLNAKVSNHSNYYRIDVTDDLKIICLDFYEFSVIGYDEDTHVYKDAMKYLHDKNPNEDLNDNDNLEGIERRFIAINGALSEQQLVWLKDELENLKDQKKKVLICGHQPIHPDATRIPGCLAWNFQEVLNIINSFDKTVLAYFSGHDHYGEHFFDYKTNILHITFDAILETQPGSNAFATIKVFNNKITIDSVGVVGYHEIHFTFDQNQLSIN